MAITTIKEENWGTRMAAKKLMNAKEIMAFGDQFPLVTFVLFCGAVVMGIATFSYLHNKKQVDFYHSLPVKRGLQFAVHITTGILLPAVIYLIAVGMAVVVAASNGVVSGELLSAAISGYLANLMYYVLVYATVVLAVMMTGTIVASLLGSAVFFWYFLGLSGIVTAFCENWLDAYYYAAPSVWTQVLCKISPVWAVISAIAYGITPGKIAGSLIATVLLLAASFFLYQRRPSEAAGKTMAFPASMPVIKVLLVILFGMTGALFFSAAKDSLGWMVFGAIAGVVISHCVIEVIYHSDFKKLFCHEKVMALCMTITLLICFSFYFDLFQFDRYVLKEDQVKEATINLYQDWWVAYGFDGSSGVSQDGRDYLIEHGKVQNIPALLEIAQEGIRQMDIGDERDSYDQISPIIIRYTLKSGRKVYRQYHMSLEPVLEAADAIYMEPEMKRAIYPGLTLALEEAAEHLAYCENWTTDAFSGVGLDQRKRIVEAYQEEMMAMSLSQRKKECPVGELLLISQRDYEMIQEETKDWDYQYRSYASGYFNGYYYPIYPSFVKTLAALKDCGIEVGASLSPDHISNIQVHVYHDILLDDEEAAEEAAAAEETVSEETVEEEITAEGHVIEKTLMELSGASTFTYTDPEQIRAILESSYFYNYANKNPMLRSEAGYEVEVILKDETVDGDAGMRGSFYEGQVPAFIRDELK